MKYKTKIFMGYNDNTADNMFNEWIKDKTIEILDFRYQEARSGDHSIAILYIDKDLPSYTESVKLSYNENSKPSCFGEHNPLSNALICNKCEYREECSKQASYISQFKYWW